MEGVNIALAVALALATSAYAVFVADRTVRSYAAERRVRQLTRTLRRPRYEVSQQSPLEVAGRTVQEDLPEGRRANVAPERALELLYSHDLLEKAQFAIELESECIETLSRNLVEGWRLIANPSVIAPDRQAFLFDALVEGPPGRLPCVVEAKALAQDTVSSEYLLRVVFQFNAQVDSLKQHTQQGFQQLIVFATRSSTGAHNARAQLAQYRGLIERTNTFVGTFTPSAGLMFSFANPPFVRFPAREDSESRREAVR